MAILSIMDLCVSFKTPLGQVLAVDRFSLDLEDGETLALVGETGCGKSVVASSVLGLLPGNAQVAGEILFHGIDLRKLNEKEISRIRGKEISLVFQNPSLALNPVQRIGGQVAEPLQVHHKMSKKMSLESAERMLKKMGLCSECRSYPFQLSGGMNQRAMIAASVISTPKIIIADEPSKGLDASMARDIMDELAGLKEQNSSSLLLITHDLSMARRISDRLAIMYCGEIMELGAADEIFEGPMHPYTKALLNCLPEKGFHPIAGPSPSMTNPPRGCKFHPRCPKKYDMCMQRPDIKEIKGGSKKRGVRCWLC
jgi:peptide/nickel transport system ATP-binding protein